MSRDGLCTALVTIVGILVQLHLGENQLKVAKSDNAETVRGNLLEKEATLNSRQSEIRAQKPFLSVDQFCNTYRSIRAMVSRRLPYDA